MPLELTDFNKFMSELMRILIQEKVRERGYQAWGDVQEELQRSGLARRLEGYTAQEEMQNRLLQAGYSRDVVKMILASVTKGTEGFGRPGVEALERIRQLGLGETPGIPPEVPGQYEEVTAPYAQLLPALARRLQEGEYPSREEMAILTRLLGPEKVQEFLKQAEKVRSEKGKLKVAQRKVTVEERKLGLEEKGKKDLGKTLIAKIKLLKATQEKLAKPVEDVTREQKALWQSNVEELEQEINEIRARLGKKTDEQYRALAVQLNARGFALADLDKNKELIASLKSRGYNIARLKRFFQ